MKGSLVFLVVVFAAFLAITALWQVQLGLLLSKLRVETRVVLGCYLRNLALRANPTLFRAKSLSDKEYNTYPPAVS